jgi:hypothetical protein
MICENAVTITTTRSSKVSLWSSNCSLTVPGSICWDLREVIWESESKRDHRDALAEEHTLEISQTQANATHLRSVTFLTLLDPNHAIFCYEVTQLLRPRTAQVTLTGSVGEDEQHRAS